MRMIKTFKREWNLHVMLLPAVALLLVYAYLPMVGALIAFQDFVPSGGLLQFFKQDWVGLENFQLFFGLRDTWQVLMNTVSIALMKIIANIIVPLVLALLLNELKSTPFKRATQTILYIPYFLSWVILSGILVDILSPTDGIINKVIVALGGKPVFFLGSNSTIQGVFVASNVWKDVGYNLVIFLAALTSIEREQYEAAEVDGANFKQLMFHITLPNMLPIIILLTVLGMGNILNAGFDQVFNLYSPIVYQKSDIIDTFVYRIGIDQLQYSLSAAMGLFKSVVSLVFITVSFYLAGRFANYKIF